MLKQRALKIAAKAAVMLLRAIFRLPDGAVAGIFKPIHRLAQKSGLPPEVVSDIGDIRDAMKSGPPPADSARGVILKSDPQLVAQVLFEAMRGDPPLEEIDPW